ncbi:purple acid phosphatase family protein [Corynebacterium guangdongense]|uniref:3',5'-cyclic AMP phosphodiesterase CpdA n=1 Tax=Corynebacterium guangdongense TaxID=1783348 RepID=A0ABU1ZWK2_9CORY|nr:metallophosphoesterase family protein [Corynebacterium guangdongense]MDR7329309.1 3',5'-cyclic AMP phosphodiesterase CpdA [Corynebacterium guangdongense]
MLTASITSVSLGLTATPAMAVDGLSPAPGVTADVTLGAELTAPAVGFDSGIERDAPFTAVPHDVVLGVGASESEIMLNWITAQGLTGQAAQLSVNGSFDDAITVQAQTENVDIVNTEGDSRKKEEGAYIEYRAGAVNRVTVADLAENTTYSYRVGSEADGWSEVQTFNTGTYGDKWNFLFFGDTQLYNTHDDRAEELAAWEANLATATTENPETSFILSAGDQANHSNWDEHSAYISPETLRNYRLAVNNGNHDNYNIDAYETMYPRPNTVDENYFFEYNNALFLSLDSNDYKDLDEDVEFLRTTVAEHGEGKDWIILTYHHSTYSQAYHMDDARIKYQRERLTPVISELNVDLVLGGHDHIYTRSHLMNGFTPVTEGVGEAGDVLYPKQGEVVYVAANSSSGSKFYDFYDFEEGARFDTGLTFQETYDQQKIRTYTALWDQDYVQDYTNVEVTPQGLTVTTKDAVSGELVDQFTLAKKDRELESEVDPTQGDLSSTGTPSTDDGSATASLSSVGGILAPLLAVLGLIGGFFLAGGASTDVAARLGVDLPL